MNTNNTIHDGTADSAVETKQHLIPLTEYQSVRLMELQKFSFKDDDGESKSGTIVRAINRDFLQVQFDGEEFYTVLAIADLRYAALGPALYSG